MKRHSLTCSLLPLLTILMLLAGCATFEAPEQRHAQYRSQVTIYLGAPEKISAESSFILSGLSIVKRDGNEIALLSSPLTIYSGDLKGTREVIAEGPVPEDEYQAIKLYIQQPSIIKNGTENRLLFPDGNTVVPIEASIRRHVNRTFFMTWNVDASTAKAPSFEPAFNIVHEQPDLSSLAVYVTNEGSDNVSVINRQSGEVVATIMVGKRPRGITVSGDRTRRKVFVANSGSDSVSVIDPGTNKVDREIPVRLGQTPTGITAVSTDLLDVAVFVTAYDSNAVLVIDASTFQETGRIEVGQGPIAVAADPPETSIHSGLLKPDEVGLLESFRKKSFNVYVANYNSNSVSVLRIDNRTMRCTGILNIDVDWHPTALYVDYPHGRLYVANSGSDRLSVIDIVKVSGGITSGAVTVINGAGRDVVDVISDPVFDRLYLLLRSQGAVSILRRPFESFESISAVHPLKMGRIRVGANPLSFVLDPESSRIYVVNRGSDSVSVIDKASRRNEMTIPVGQNPYGIAVFPDPF